MIYCPNCGEISKENVKVYDEKLKKQNINIAPVNPTCKLCYAQVTISHTANGGNIVVLNGTCGSDKTTVAEGFLTTKGFLNIDGDCAVQTLQYKTGQKKYEWSELIDEIACEIDILSMFGENIVLSHVVLPEDLERFIKIFERRNLNYKFFLLRPEYQTAVERCRNRTCHETITPEKWIKHFYDILVFDERVEVVDNTNMTAEQTIEYILERFTMLPEGIYKDDFTLIKYIHKGLSPDKKYFIESKDHKQLLLRIADIEELERKKNEYAMLELAFKTGILMSCPVEFGLCDSGKKVYQLLTWVHGTDLQEAIPNMSLGQLYSVGLKAGQTLKRLHSIPAPFDVKPWNEIFHDKIVGRLEQLREQNISDPKLDLLINYVCDNENLLLNRPQCLNHGDYNISNLILTPDGQVGVIDFNAFTSIYGDPYWEFCGIPYGHEVNESYYSGMFDGYFEETSSQGLHIPENFFPLLAFYYAYDGIAAICETIGSSDEAKRDAWNHMENIIRWFNDMKSVVPSWYMGYLTGD